MAFEQKRIVRGVRTVAIFEAMKGALVCIAGFGLLALVHRDVQAIAEHIVRHLHLNPARHYPRVFIDAAGHVNDSNLVMLALFAGVYAIVRFVEAYGLWRMRVWAEWFAIVSGGIYLPIEIYELFERATWTRGAILLVNLFIVGYMVYVRATGRREGSEVRQ